MMTCKCHALFFLCLKPYFRILYCHPLLQFLGAFCTKSMPAAKTLEKGTEPLIPLWGWGKNLCQRHGFVSWAGRAVGWVAQGWGCEGHSCSLPRMLLAGPATSLHPSPQPSVTGWAALGKEGKTLIHGSACFCTRSLLVETSRSPCAVIAACPPFSVKYVYSCFSCKHELDTQNSILHDTLCSRLLQSEMMWPMHSCSSSSSQ